MIDDKGTAQPGQAVKILIADDDPDDRLLARQALAESHLCNDVDFVQDGFELLQYLRCEGDYEHLAGEPEVGIILLDLNMPKMDGREALKEIKSDPELRHIPVVVLTTSQAEKDIFQSYDYGVSSYIMKPVTFEGLVEVMKDFSRYWFQIVTLPEMDT